MIVIHYTAMATVQAARARLCDPASGVSAHYLIDGSGGAERLVDETARAWHAGAGRWGPVDDVNSRSIGIELANDGAQPFAEPQMAALEELLGAIMQRWPVTPDRVIGHSDMAPARKQDPGPRFDWRRLALGGLSVWPRRGSGGGDFLADAARFGYPVGDVSQSDIVAAFRQRFRPWAAGPLDATDRALMHDLACRFPVDRVAASA